VDRILKGVIRRRRGREKIVSKSLHVTPYLFLDGRSCLVRKFWHVRGGNLLIIVQR